MARLYLVDSYNVILQNRALNEVLDYEGLAAARRALRQAAEDFARRTGSRVRLIFDGAQDPHGHIETFENQWIDVSFTSRGEKADERLVAVALECRRRGEKPVIVSDDVKGIREPLEREGFVLQATAAFTKLLTGRGDRPGEARGNALSEQSRKSLETEFLARDAARRQAELENAGKATERAGAATRPAPAKPAPPPPPQARPAATPASRSEPRTPSAEDLARKERGRKKQERRIALLQSRKRNR